MALDTFFSLSALHPVVDTYNPGRPNDPMAQAMLYSYGGHTKYYNPYSLQSQTDNDLLIIGNNPVDPSDENDLTNVVDQIYRRNVFIIVFRGVNIPNNRQYLLIFELSNMANTNVFGLPNAQFFVGNKWVRTEVLLTQQERVAILFDAPTGKYVFNWVAVRLASSYSFSLLGLRCVDCHLILSPN